MSREWDQMGQGPSKAAMPRHCTSTGAAQPFSIHGGFARTLSKQTIELDARRTKEWVSHAAGGRHVNHCSTRFKVRVWFRSELEASNEQEVAMRLNGAPWTVRQ